MQSCTRGTCCTRTGHRRRRTRRGGSSASWCRRRSQRRNAGSTAKRRPNACWMRLPRPPCTSACASCTCSSGWCRTRTATWCRTSSSTAKTCPPGTKPSNTSVMWSCRSPGYCPATTWRPWWSMAPKTSRNSVTPTAGCAAGSCAFASPSPACYGSVRARSPGHTADSGSVSWLRTPRPGRNWTPPGNARCAIRWWPRICCSASPRAPSCRSWTRRSGPDPWSRNARTCAPGRCCSAHRIAATRCCPRRSSSTTIPLSRRKARSRCSTAPRSTRS